MKLTGHRVVKINKNSAYRQLVLSMKYVLAGCICISLISAPLASLMWENPYFFVRFLWFIPLSAIAQILNGFYAADVELQNEYCQFITWFKIIKIRYDEFEIYFVERTPYAAYKFVIHANKGKFYLAYTKEKFAKIKDLLLVCKSKFSFAEFDKKIKAYFFTPGWDDRCGRG